jgi:hypothetical protein
MDELFGAAFELFGGLMDAADETRRATPNVVDPAAVVGSHRVIRSRKKPRTRGKKPRCRIVVP